MVLIQPITPPEEGLVYTENNIKLKIGDRYIGKGVLYLTSSALAWQPNDRPEGISVQWKDINVHGISTSPTKCLYFMMEQQIIWPGVYEQLGVNGNAQNGNDAHEAGNVPMDEQHFGENMPLDDEEDEGNVTDEEDFPSLLTECWLLPDDINTVEIIFRAMNDCQELNPDPQDSVSEESDFMDEDDEEEGHFYVPNARQHNNEEDDAEGAQGGIRNLNINDDRFADADDPS